MNIRLWKNGEKPTEKQAGSDSAAAMPQSEHPTVTQLPSDAPKGDEKSHREIRFPIFAKKQNNPETELENYAYHWNYAAYNDELKRRNRKNDSKQSMKILMLLIFLCVLLIMTSVFLGIVVYRLKHAERTTAATPSQNLQQQQMQSYFEGTMNDDAIARGMNRLQIATMKIKDDLDESITGHGYLLDGGYILTDIAALRSEHPCVVDENGDELSTTVLFSDINTHLAVLLPDDTISGRTLSVSSTAFTGQLVYLAGYYRSDPDNLVAQMGNITYQNGDGVLGLSMICPPELDTLSLVCNINMELIGVYTSSGAFQVLDNLAHMIETAREALIASEKGFEEYYVVNFGDETVYESVQTAEAELYHIPQGVRITQVSQSGNAALAGLRVGDIISAVNDTAITDAADFEKALADIKGPYYSISVYRDSTYYSVMLRAGADG